MPIVTEAQAAEIDKLLAKQNLPVKMYRRLTFIKNCGTAGCLIEAARTVGFSETSAHKWRNRFQKSGINGLRDAVRSGRPAKATVELEKRLLELLTQDPPAGYCRWFAWQLKERLEVSRAVVYGLLAKNRIKLHRSKCRCVSKDPEFAAKAAAICQAYTVPRADTVTYCVDEKTCIQALQRDHGFTRDGKTIVTAVGSTYKRLGTTHLFAAYNADTGEVVTECRATKTKVDFVAFLDRLVALHPPKQRIAIILDNLSTHKNLGAWREKHPGVVFFYPDFGQLDESGREGLLSAGAAGT
jgi:transposase